MAVNVLTVNLDYLTTT